MRAALRSLVVCSAIVAMCAPVAGQETDAWPERVSIAFDVPFDALRHDFAEALSFADSVRKTEMARFNADYAVPRGILFDIGTAIRVSRRIGIGVTASIVKRTASGAFQLTVPSVIAGNTPLSLGGSVNGLERRDVGVHVQALYPLALGNRSRLTLSAGPSIYSVSQDLVRSIAFDTLPGLTTVQFDQAFIMRASKTAVGFNVGADVGWAVAAHLGITAVARYSRARVTLDPGSASGVSRAVAVEAGGLHVGAGLRFPF